MTTHEETKIFAGVFRFATGVTPEALNEFLKEKSGDPAVLSLCVRKVTKEQYGFQIIYDIGKSEWVKSYSELTFKIKDMLYKHFGARLHSWDYGPVDYLIK